MPTPIARSPLNVYEGISPDDLNQLLGTHAPVVVYAPSGGQSALVGPSLGPSFGQMQFLDDGYQDAVWLDQPFTMSGTVLDRVQLPVSIGGGLGNDLLVGLYADSAGAASGLPLAQTLVPKQFLQPSPCADYNGVILGAWNSSSPNLVLPANLAVINSQAFTDDGTYMVAIGGWDSTTPVTTVAVAMLATAGLDAWGQSTPLPVALASASASFANGTIIVIGGSKSTTAAVNTVYTAGYSGGVVSAWISQAALPQALTGVATEVVTLAQPSPSGATTIVYAVGGATLAAGPTYTAKTSVYSASMDSGGNISTWQTPAGSQLPVALYNGQLVQCNGWLVYMGGTNASMSEVSTVYGARINQTTGTIGSWIPFPSLPFVCSTFGAYVVDSNIVVVNGVGTAFAASLAMNSGGPASAWVTQPAPPTTAYSNCSTVTNGTIVYPGLINNVGTTLPGVTSLVQSVPSLSVPLHATGLSNSTTYHVVVSPLGLIDGINRTQVAITTQPSSAFPAIVRGTTGQLSVAVLPASMSTASTLSGWFGNTDAPTVTFPAGASSILSTTTSTAAGFDLIATATGKNGIKVGPFTSITFSLTATDTSGTPRSVGLTLYAYDATGTFISTFGGSGYSTDSGATALTCTATTPAGTAYVTFAIIVQAPAVGEKHTFSVISGTVNSGGYIPLSLYTSGKTLKPMHVLDDIVNNQPNEWNTIAYDYWGKPVLYGECVLPMVNLLTPNQSNLGGPIAGTLTGWLAGTSTTLGISNYSGPLDKWSAQVGAAFNNGCGTVTFTASTLTDAQAAYMLTNLYAGSVITVYSYAADGVTVVPFCTGVVASNTGTVLTLTAAGWVDANGNPANPAVFNGVSTEFYAVGSSAVLSPATPGFPNINLLQDEYQWTLERITTTGTASAITPTGTSGIPVVAGRHYTAFAWMASQSQTTRQYYVTILWYTASGAACSHASDIGSAAAGILDPFGNGVYVQPYVNAVAPATAAFAAVYIEADACLATETHMATCVQFALDNSLQSGLSTPQLAYFEPQAGPGGTRTFLQLVYDTAPATFSATGGILSGGTSQLTGIVDISATAPLFFGTGATVTYGVTADGFGYATMTDTQAQWPMNGLVGAVVSAPSSITSTSSATTTTATVAFNTATTIVFTPAGWSNGQPSNGTQYSIS